jgi:hypothetical protein
MMDTINDHMFVLKKRSIIDGTQVYSQQANQRSDFTYEFTQTNALSLVFVVHLGLKSKQSFESFEHLLLIVISPLILSLTSTPTNL